MLTQKTDYKSKNASTHYSLTIFVLICPFVLLAQQSVSYNANSAFINGYQNNAFGYQVLTFNVGTGNVANGFQAMYTNTTGYYNTANGSQAMYYNTGGANNVANGYNALRSNTLGNQNTANGYYSLYSNTTGNNNTATGFETNYVNITGDNNTATGYVALADNTASDNTATGSYSLNTNITGFQNVANGGNSLRSNQSGTSNSSFGHNSLFTNVSGSYNTALGDSAGYKSVGNGNVFIGYKAGSGEQGNNKMYIGNENSRTLFYGDFSTGQILLGNLTPTGYIFKGTRTLNVIGGIISDSVRVALSSTWADYVFADGYKLKPLNELDTYIKANKHLPNIPSEDEVKKNGIDLAAMNAKLLEKVEELHLYVLQLQKQSEMQEKQIAVQQKQIDELLKRK